MSEKNPTTPSLKTQRRELARHIAGIKKDTPPGATKDLGISAGRRLLAELDRRIRVSAAESQK